MKSISDRKTTPIRIRLKQNEKDALIQYISDHELKGGLTGLIRPLLRELLNQTPEFNYSDLKALRENRYELRKIGINLNQIARKINETDDPNHLLPLRQLTLKVDTTIGLINDQIERCTKRLVHYKKVLKS